MVGPKAGSPPAAGEEVMMTETPRLVHLTTETGSLLDDGAEGEGLSQAQSPALSCLVFMSSGTEEARPPAPLGEPKTAVGRLAASAGPSASPISRKEATAASRDTATSSSFRQSSPVRHKEPLLSNVLSFQSSIVALEVSAAHTPRANNDEIQLPTFATVPVTPVRGTSLANGITSVQLADLDGSQDLPSNAITGVMEQDGTVIDVADAGKRASRAGSSGHFCGSVGEESLEYTDVSLNTSLRNGTSSTGGKGDRHYASLYGAAFHIFKANVGAGVFLLPTYYQDAGYLVGGLLVVLLGALMIECTVSLLHVKHRINHVEVKTYPAVVEFVLGEYFKKFVQFSLVFTQFGFCIMFLQYASSMFAAFFNESWAYKVFVGVSTVVVTPMTLISNKLHVLVYASILAGMFVLAVLSGITVVDIERLSRAGIAKGVRAAIPTPRLIVFISGHMFSLEGIGVVLPVENSVAPENRAQFGKVLRYTLLAIVTFYVFFGVLGYAAYGEKLHTSVVLALPPSGVKQTLQVLLGLSLIFGFPIQYVPAIQVMDRAFGVSITSDKKEAFLLRVALNASFGLVAVFVGSDTINIFASFLGSFAGVHLMVTVPALLALQIDHALKGDKEKYSCREYLLLLFEGPYTIARSQYYVYLLLAVVVWFGGLYYTLVSIFER
nr:unnamed protein product [Leishmania braziliensis]